jgi:hypothetical protein
LAEDLGCLSRYALRMLTSARAGLYCAVVLPIMVCAACAACPPLEQSPASKAAFTFSMECYSKYGSNRCPLLKPRCAKEDPQCGPMAMGNYYGCYDRRRLRKSVFAWPTGPSCQHDGECAVTHGCDGSHCTHFTLYPVGPEACNFSDDPGDPRDSRYYDDVLCGCVSGRCSVFTL